jgi:hypothetical protein
VKTRSRDLSGRSLRHPSDEPASAWSALHGHAAIAMPDAIEAGAPTTVTLRYTCPTSGLQVGDAIAIAWRLPGDWGSPQCDDPTAPNFVSVRSNGAEFHVTYEDQGGIKPWNHQLTFTCRAGSLDAGAVVTITIGDTAQGSAGWESQTSAATAHEFVVMRRPRGHEEWVRVPEPSTLRIVGGRARAMHLVLPSDAVMGEPVAAVVRMTDAWGNPSRGHRGDWMIGHPAVEVVGIERVEWHGEALDVWEATLVFTAAGRHRIRVQEQGGLVSVANPIDCRDTGAPEKLVWGEVHGGQGELGCGQGTLDEFYRFARSVAGLQFVAHQANDVYVTRQEWEHTREQTRRADQPGRFVTLLGCEWTAPTSVGGDRNIVHRGDTVRLHRAARWFEERLPDDWADAPDPASLYRLLPSDAVVVNLHAGGYTSNLSVVDEAFHHLVEIHSTHGTSDWLVAEAIARGITFGVSAGSDGIAGRPGACHPGRRATRNVPNGCLGTYVRELDRESVFEALRLRRCFATDGQRIRLAVSCNGHAMGAEVHAEGPPAFAVEVAGTAAIERIVLRRGRNVVAVADIAMPDEAHPARWRLLWQGNRATGTARDQTLTWDGHATVERGAMTLVEPLGYYGADDGVEQRDRRTVAWRSRTAGNAVGFTLDLTDVDAVTFWSRALRCTLPLDAATTSRFDLDPAAGRGHVELGRAPSPDGPQDVHVALADTSAAPGKHPYWVEVTQVDGARAWSSPIFVSV